MEKTHWKKVGNVQKNQLERPRRNLKKLKISRGTNYETLEKAGKKRELVEIPMNPHSFLRITMENHNFEEVYQLFPLIIWLTFIFFRGFQTTNQ
jgi:hypothetical protein